MIEQDSQMLCNIQKTLSVDPYASQRTLAHNTNVSLGQMNAVLKRCAERGWIAIRNLNMRKVCYYLTPKGLEEISNRTSGYMKSSFRMMNEYAEKVASVVQKAKDDGKINVILVGQSNIRFIIEWACERFEMKFIELNDCDIIEKDTIVLLGELVDKDCEFKLTALGAVSVMEI